MKAALLRIILPLVLILQTIYVWYCFYRAQFLEYDDDYGLIFHAFFISVLVMFVLISLAIWWRPLMERYFWVTMAWIFLGSPVTLIIALLKYQEIFGANLSAG